MLIFFLNQSFLILSSFLFLVLMLKVLSELFNFEYPKHFTFLCFTFGVFGAVLVVLLELFLIS